MWLHLKQRQRGFDEATYVESFLVLNALGGDCLEDFDRLREDAGLGEMLFTDGLRSSCMRQDWLEAASAYGDTIVKSTCIGICGATLVASLIICAAARGVPSAETLTIDLYPDLSELDADERCALPAMTIGDKPAYVYSAWNQKTVLRRRGFEEHYRRCAAVRTYIRNRVRHHGRKP